MNNVPPKEWYHRWKRHIIINSFAEISNLIQHRLAAIDNSFPAQCQAWFLLVCGGVCGGFGVHLVRYIINDVLVSYLP